VIPIRSLLRKQSQFMQLLRLLANKWLGNKLEGTTLTPPPDSSAYTSICFQVGEILHEKFGGSSMGMVRGILEDDKSIFDFFVPRELFPCPR
jgi:hypothetical protein